MSAGKAEASGVRWADLPPARGAALSALAESYYYLQRLGALVEALDDPRAPAYYVDLALSSLERLQTRLEAPQKAGGERREPRAQSEDKEQEEDSEAQEQEPEL